jgi:hypothetical protein
MPDFAALIKKLVGGVATDLTDSLRTEIQHVPQTGSGRYGPEYGEPVLREALIIAKSETVASADGTEKVSSSHFTFFEQFTLKEGDRFILNGVTMNVIKVGGLLDPDGVPYIPEAWTGK